MDMVLATALIAILVIAAAVDLRSSRIPNWLTFSAMGFALAMHTWLHSGHGTLFSLAGLGVGLGLFLFVYIAGGIGAGDVKLMAAVGSFVGAYGALSCAWLAFVVGGVYAIAAMIYQWGFAAAGQRLVSAACGVVWAGGSTWTRELELPFKLRYGFAIAGGTLLFLAGLHPFGG
jgi:prepilin peptidase CpaA